MKLGVPELVLILVIVLIIFGAGKLPQLFDAIGKGISKLRKRNDEDTELLAKQEAEEKKAKNSEAKPAEEKTSTVDEKKAE